MLIREILNPKFGTAFTRISKALHKYAPQDINWTDSNLDADVIILHIVGGDEYIVWESLPKEKVVAIQHCFYTTYMNVNFWENIWQRSILNVSFHNLKDYSNKDFQFYRTPWGADTDLFINNNTIKDKKIFATGYVANTECLDLLYEACKETNNILHHTGKNFGWDKKFYKYHNYLGDKDFVSLLNSVEYVSGLRLIEGFEMMCIEGAMCGATPIVPDLPTYDFYKDFGICIDVSNQKIILEQLSSLLSSAYYKLTDDKINFVRNKFSWKNIINNIFQEIKKRI